MDFIASISIAGRTSSRPILCTPKVNKLSFGYRERQKWMLLKVPGSNYNFTLLLLCLGVLSVNNYFPIRQLDNFITLAYALLQIVQRSKCEAFLSNFDCDKLLNPTHLTNRNQ